jgi:hypothetical protein
MSIKLLRTLLRMKALIYSPQGSIHGQRSQPRKHETVKWYHNSKMTGKLLIHASLSSNPGYANPDDQDSRSIFPFHPSQLKPRKSIHLVLSGTGLWELEDNTTAGESSVDLGVGVESVVNTSTLLLVKNDLEDLGGVLLGADALADDLDWEDEVGEDGVVDGGESSGAWALLGEGGSRAVRALWSWENTAGSEDQDVAVGELLLELTGETIIHLCQ